MKLELESLSLWAFFFLCIGNIGASFAEDTPNVSKMAMLEPRIKKLSFNEYVMGVLEVLASNPKFEARAKQLHSEPGTVLISEKLADHLNVLPKDVLDKLDKLKRAEVQKLIRLTKSLSENGFPDEDVKRVMKKTAGHLDIQPSDDSDNYVTSKEFTSKDLEALIRETNKELVELDKARKHHYKEYEMHKKLEYMELKKRLAERQLAVFEERDAQLYMHHKKSKPTHFPLSKAHLLEVWEERNHMEEMNFNMKTFFHMYDLDGNNLWDDYELKFVLKETLSKSNDQKADPKYDPVKHDEALERAREESLRAFDVNNDRFISLEEFLESSRNEALTDHYYWEELGNKPEFTDEEFQQYAAEHKDEVNRMIDAGLVELPDPKKIRPIAWF